MNDNAVKITADKIKKRNKMTKRLKLILLILFFVLVLIYFILSVVFEGANFTISLDPEFTNEKRLYENRKEIKGNCNAWYRSG